jgi:hypothetical protein
METPERRCPCCNQLVEVKDGPPLGRLLSVIGSRSSRSRRLVEKLARDYPIPTPSSDLADYVYAEDEDGGPLWPDSNMRVLVSRLRASLPRAGWTIDKVRYRGYVLSNTKRRQ